MTINISEEKEHIKGFLQKNGVGVLATASPDGEPHAAAIYYLCDDDLNIFFLTKSETLKNKNIQKNPSVALAVHENKTQTTVQIHGKASEVTDRVKMNQVFADLLKVTLKTSETGVPPLSKLNAGEYIVYQIKPVSIKMASFIRPDSGNFEDIFEVV